MEQHFLDTLYVISCAIQNKKVVLRKDMDLGRILREADIQSCGLLSLSTLISAENSELLKDLKSMRRHLLIETSKQTLRYSQINEMINDLDEYGLNPIIIKGPILAELYPDPILREFSDIDIFFADVGQCDEATEYLISRGGKLKDVISPQKHNSIELPDIGTVELHHSLYGEDFHKLHLKNEEIIKQPFEKITIQDESMITTLGKTDTIKFVFCHMIGHFLFTRCNIKQICDILLYIRRYRSDIDSADLFDFLNKTGCMRAFAIVIGSGIEYLGFNETELFPVEYSSETVELFLTDCFKGCTKGLMNNKSVARGLGTFSSELHKDRKELLKRVMNGFFPKKKLLTSLYPYYERNPILLPVAWVNNIIDLSKGALTYNSKYHNRKSLLKKMGIM